MEGITTAKLTALNNVIAAYNSLVSKPRDTRAASKTVTGNLPTEFDAADEDLVQMDDLPGQGHKAGIKVKVFVFE